MASGVHLKVSVDRVAAIRDSIQELAKREVLVGFPRENADRDPEPGDPPTPITNAALGYIHDNGAPEQNIPARPFMRPGVERVKGWVAQRLAATAKAVLKQSGVNVDDQLDIIGLKVSTSIKNVIAEGVEPPLADATLRGRMARGAQSSVAQGAFWELAWRRAGAPASTEIAKPLIVTAQMRNAITYVVRYVRDRKK